MTKANVQLVQPRRKYRMTGMLPLDFSLWLTDFRKIFIDIIKGWDYG